MPLKLYNGCNGSKNFRIRGSHFKVRIDQSSGTSNRDEARKVLKKIKDEIERDAFNPKPIGPTFIQAVDLYVRETKNERFLFPLVKYFGDRKLHDITQQDIMRASHDLYPNVTNATRNRQVFTPVLAIMKMNGVMIIAKRPENGKGNRRTFFLTKENAIKLVTAAYEQNEEFGLFLMFLLYTGARLGEALNLTVDNLYINEARALFPSTKNGRPRTVHLPPVLVAAMANHPRGYNRDGKVFRYHAGSALRQRLRDAETASGVRLPPKLAFHAFRHTWGAWMRRYGGLDTSGLIATGAWFSRDAAMVYEHADASDAARRADLLPEIKLAVKLS